MCDVSKIFAAENITSWLTIPADGPVDASTVVKTRANLHQAKSLISDLKKQGLGDLFDVCVRLLNPYEKVTDVRVSTVSRAFFKLHEILHRFPVLNVQQMRCLVLGLCEAPGGFLDCVNHFRRNCPTQDLDRWMGYSRPKSEKVDGFHPKLVTDTRGCIVEGDILKDPDMLIWNINSFCASHMADGFDLVTCDGGFEIPSGDLNQQDLCHQKLIDVQSQIGVWSVRKGGSFVMKLFDVFDYAELLFQFTQLFSQVFIVKPYASRPANSERYLVGIGKLGNPDDFLAMRNSSPEYEQRVQEEYARFEVQFVRYACAVADAQADLIRTLVQRVHDENKSAKPGQDLVKTLKQKMYNSPEHNRMRDWFTREYFPEWSFRNRVPKPIQTTQSEKRPAADVLPLPKRSRSASRTSKA